MSKHTVKIEQSNSGFYHLYVDGTWISCSATKIGAYFSLWYHKRRLIAGKKIRPIYYKEFHFYD